MPFEHRSGHRGRNERSPLAVHRYLEDSKHHHGYSDWVLRHQESFEIYAATIERFFAADLVVAHNAEFDVGFYNREMERLGRGPISKPIFCTMGGYRQKILHDGRVPPERISRERIFERHLPPNWGYAVYETSRGT